MINKLHRFLACCLLSMTCTALSAQSPKPVKDSQSFGTFFAAYNPHTWRYDDGMMGKSDGGYHGLAVGFSYFVPFAGALGVDAGLQGQYSFRRTTMPLGKQTLKMLSATVPLSLAFDWPVTDAFAIHPYGGLYGRFVVSAKTEDERGGRRYTSDWFKGSWDNGGMPSGDMNRLQVGWQVGANLRLGEVFTIGGAYWMDFNEVAKYYKMYGFNIIIGASF